MRLVISTSPVAKAPELAKTLVEERLVACVNIVPRVRSFYIWEDKLEDDEESLLVMKTTADAVKRLSDRLIELHPYEVPEIVSVDIQEGEGNEAYLRWVREMVTSKQNTGS